MIVYILNSENRKRQLADEWIARSESPAAVEPSST